ncbi:hypothetical protein [Halorientalis halophila]|uniref:hypothetical protein n=1 Tax=Halorientalis halophila TaxID=3108499 RepID=UPI003008C913
MTALEDIEDDEDFREALTALLEAAEAGNVSSEAVAGLLTLQLAGVRGDVRLPLAMPPERARRFTETARENVGERMEVELLVSEDVVHDLELQLQAFADGEGD